MRQGGRAWVRDVAMCGSVWACPVCGGRILAARRGDILKGLEAAHARGWTSLLLTLTFYHRPEERLADVLGDLVAVWAKVKAGGWWAKLRKRAGIVGDIQALEVTWGVNGWHPHRHIALVFDHKVNEVERKALQAELCERFRSVAKCAGRWASRDWGIVLSRGAASYVAKMGHEASYVAKMGHEVAGSVKAGLSPFRLAEAAAGGDRLALARWAEYLAAVKGRRRVVWSRGLRDVLGLEDEVSAEAAAALEQEGETAELVAVLTHDQWREVYTRFVVGDLVAKAAEGSAAVWGFLESLGLHRTIENWRLEQRLAAFGMGVDV